MKGKFDKLQKVSKYYENDCRTPLGTKIDFFVTTANGSHSLTVVVKDFILDTADALDLSLSVFSLIGVHPLTPGVH